MLKIDKSLRTLLELDVVVGESDDAFQCAQDQRVDIIIEVDFIVVILQREDAVHWNSHVGTELLQLCLKNPESRSEQTRLESL